MPKVKLNTEAAHPETREMCHPGDVVEFDAATAAALIEKGRAEAVKETKAAPKEPEKEPEEKAEAPTETASTSPPENAMKQRAKPRPKTKE